jgi:hypothetical protein
MLTRCFVTADKMLDGLAAAAVKSLTFAIGLTRGRIPMRNESTAQPFEAELDRYVESVVLPQAARLGDSAAPATWMEQEAAGYRKFIAEIRLCWRPNWPAGSLGEHLQGSEAGLALKIATANLLEQLAREVREARGPKTRH